MGKHFATYTHICTSFIVFSIQLEQGLFERCTQNGDKKNLLKGKHKAGSSGARGPEVGGS